MTFARPTDIMINKIGKFSTLIRFTVKEISSQTTQDKITNCKETEKGEIRIPVEYFDKCRGPRDIFKMKQ